MSAFSSRFDLATGNARITVESQNQYWGAGVLADLARADLVRLTDDMDAHMLLEPSEALALAAALQAVAVHLMEDKNSRSATPPAKKKSRTEGKSTPQRNIQEEVRL